MKYLTIIFAFLAGLATAWIVWDLYTIKIEKEEVAIDLANRISEAKVSEQILSYMASPNPSIRQHLSYISSNAIAFFPSYVDFWDKRYPFLQIKARYEPDCERFQIFLRERRNKVQTNTVLGD
jgi:hypothetical protein